MYIFYFKTFLPCFAREKKLFKFHRTNDNTIIYALSLSEPPSFSIKTDASTPTNKNAKP